MVRKITLLLMMLGCLIPSYAANYLTFTAEMDTSSFGIVINKDDDSALIPFPNPKIQYSLDDGATWDSLSAGDKVVLKKRGDKALLRGTNPDGFSYQRYDYSNFVMSGSIAASGSVMSLIDNVGESTEIPANSFCCFFRLFDDCASLTQAPELPATKLGDECYREMFVGCTSLTQAPDLPATQLGYECYESMFAGCTSLKVAPDTLPATSLLYACYCSMFEGCSSLEKAPALPATVLASDCYASMFSKCTSLTTAPNLPAKVLADYCYRAMFYECSNLSQVTVNFTDWSLTDTNLWLDGVASTGTFYCPRKLAEQYVYGSDNIPLGWDVKYIEDPEEPAHYLTFTAEADSSTFGIEYDTQYVYADIRYSLDDGVTWNTLEVNDIVVLAKKGDKALLRGFNCKGISVRRAYLTAPRLRSGYVLEGTDGLGAYWYPPEDMYTASFVMSGSIAASGSVMSLIDNTGRCKAIPEYAECCFARLFKDCACLTQAPELPATKLGGGCYSEMFANCTGLTQAPELPATEMAESCYAGMFAGCTNLTQVPELPATVLAISCYAEMFAGCSSLAQAPELPATTLEFWCYSGMFANCISLTRSPKLQADVLTQMAYQKMFKGCSSLSTIEVRFSEWSEWVEGWTSRKWNTNEWVDGVAPTGTFICPDVLPKEFSIHKIPEGWNVVEKADVDCEASPNRFVWTEGSAICVSGVEGCVEVYNLKGQMLQDAQVDVEETSRFTMPVGAYVVNAGDQRVKVMVTGN